MSALYLYLLGEILSNLNPSKQSSAQFLGKYPTADISPLANSLKVIWFCLGERFTKSFSAKAYTSSRVLSRFSSWALSVFVVVVLFLLKVVVDVLAFITFPFFTCTVVKVEKAPSPLVNLST
jgi:hypothetical protein